MLANIIWIRQVRQFTDLTSCIVDHVSDYHLYMQAIYINVHIHHLYINILWRINFDVFAIIMKDYIIIIIIMCIYHQIATLYVVSKSGWVLAHTKPTVSSCSAPVQPTMQISRPFVDGLLLLWPECWGAVPWLTMWRGSSLDLEVSWSSAVVHSSQ